jgi:addiction module HigA family antidote
VIKSFADRRTVAFFENARVKGMSGELCRAARAKLLILDEAADLRDLRAVPGNRPEVLRGNRKGQHSIRINRQFRVCFYWRDGDAYEVEVTITTSEENTMSIPRGTAVDYRDLIDEDAAPGAPIHPGEILRSEFLDPLGLSANALGIAISVPRNRITEILRAERAVTADTALRLGRYFGMSPKIWTDLQSTYDLETARARLGSRLDSEVTPRAA